jgi:hypothetical protein
VNRRGVALLVALLVVMLGGVLVATSMTWATAELRAGHAWRARARFSEATASAVALALPRLNLLLDSVPQATWLVIPPDSTGGPGVNLTVLALPDSLVWLEAQGQLGAGYEVVSLLGRLQPDSSGIRPIRMDPRAHPVP